MNVPKIGNRLITDIYEQKQSLDLFQLYSRSDASDNDKSLVIVARLTMQQKILAAQRRFFCVASTNGDTCLLIIRHWIGKSPVASL